MRVFACALCVAVVGAACSAAPVHPASPRAAIVPTDDAVCPAGTQLLLEDAAIARRGTYQLHRDGTLVAPSDAYAASELRFAFPDVSPAAEVRIELVDRNDATNRHLLACGQPVGQIVGLPELPAGSLLQILLYDVPTAGTGTTSERDRATALIAGAMTTSVATLVQGERDEVRRTLLETVEPALEEVMLEPSNGALLNAKQAIKDALDDSIPNDDIDPWCGRSGPLAPAICSELHAVKDQLAAIHAVLLASAGSGSGSAAEQAIAESLATHKLADAITALAMPDRLLDRDRARHCDAVAKLRWLVADDTTIPRLVARAELPYVASDELVTTDYGRNADDLADLASGRPLGIVVRGAPVAKPGSFAAHQGNVVTADTASLLLAAIPAAMRALPFLSGHGGTHALVVDAGAVTAGRAPPKPTPNDGLSLVCVDQASARIAVEPAVMPTATVEARGFVFGPIPKKYTTDIVACEGPVCSGSNDDKQVRSRVSLTTEQHGRITLLGELSFGVGLALFNNHDRNLDGFGFGGQSSPAFAPVLGTSGPDQAFELEQDVTPRNALTSALLLAVQIPRPNVSWLRWTSPDWIVGAGPSLSIGLSGAPLSQWNLHLGARLTRGVYVMFGPSVRFVPTPSAYKIGDVASVPLPAMGGAASAPSFDTRESVLLQFDIGLAIDIGGAAQTAVSAISSLGGGK